MPFLVAGDRVCDDFDPSNRRESASGDHQRPTGSQPPATCLWTATSHFCVTQEESWYHYALLFFCPIFSEEELNHVRCLSKSPVSQVDLVIAPVGSMKSKPGGEIIESSFVTHVSTLPPRVLVTGRWMRELLKRFNHTWEVQSPFTGVRRTQPRWECAAHFFTSHRLERYPWRDPQGLDFGMVWPSSSMTSTVVDTETTWRLEPQLFWSYHRRVRHPVVIH